MGSPRFTAATRGGRDLFDRRLSLFGRLQVPPDLVDVPQVVPRHHAQHVTECLVAPLVVPARSVQVGRAQLFPERQIAEPHGPKHVHEFAGFAVVVSLRRHPKVLVHPENRRRIFRQNQPQAIAVDPYGVAEVTDDLVARSTVNAGFWCLTNHVGVTCHNTPELQTRPNKLINRSRRG